MENNCAIATQIILHAFVGDVGRLLRMLHVADNNFYGDFRQRTLISGDFADTLQAQQKNLTTQFDN